MSRSNFLNGQSIYLRPLLQTDLTDAYMQWLNDEEVCRGNSHAVFPNTEKKMQAYFESLGNTQTQVVLAIVESSSDTHIGNVTLQNINWIARSAEFAILIGEKQAWGKGYGEEAGRLMIDYAFKRLNLNRVYCGTLESNEGMKKLALALRMKQEGIRRDAIYKSGSYHNIIEFGVLKSEFEVK
jgi:[ribosomal protein S5]-alanine N-acetyltransferase